jgi:hypothetical protein
MSEQVQDMSIEVNPVEVKSRSKSAPEKEKSELEIQKEMDLRIVRGRFEFNEIAGKGATLEFSYGSIYKDVPIKKYKLVDGETYELPYMVAEHLQEDGKYAVNSYMQDENGKIHAKAGSFVRRYNFVPLGFDGEDKPNRRKTKA